MLSGHTKHFKEISPGYNIINYSLVLINNIILLFQTLQENNLLNDNVKSLPVTNVSIDKIGIN